MSADNSNKFSWEQAVVESDLPAMTRHVLLTLSVRMDKYGGSCFPTVEQLVEMTGLSKNTVLKHRAIAIEKGWLTVSNMGFRGQKWRRASYVAALPGTTRCGVANSEGGAGAAPKVVQELHQDKEQTTNQTTLERERAGAKPQDGENEQAESDQPQSTSGGTTSGDPPAGEARKHAEETFKKRFWPKWPGKAIDNRDRALAEFVHLPPGEQDKAIAGIGAFHEAQRRAKRTKPLAAATYLKQTKWQDLDGEPDAGGKYAPPWAKPWSPLWMADLFELLRTGQARPIMFNLSQAKSGSGTSLRFGQSRNDELVALSKEFERAQVCSPTGQAWMRWLEGRFIALRMGGYVPRLPDDFWLFVPNAAIAKAWDITLEPGKPEPGVTKPPVPKPPTDDEALHAFD